jgi:CheY-like chemotaxis protein
MIKPILQVEDDPNDVFLLQRAIKKAGVENPLQIASDGQEAIDYLQGAGKFADRATFLFPSLVLLDLKLPRVMGLEVLRIIRQQHGNALPVLILSGSGEESDIAAAYRLGANGFLTKPAQNDKLEEIVRAIKDFWLTYNKQPREGLSQSLTDSLIERTGGVVRQPGTGLVEEPWRRMDGRASQAVAQ